MTIARAALLAILFTAFGNTGCHTEEERDALRSVVQLVWQIEHAQDPPKTCWLLPEWRRNPDAYLSQINLVVRTANVHGGGDDNDKADFGRRLKGLVQLYYADWPESFGVNALQEDADAQCSGDPAEVRGAACFMELMRQRYSLPGTIVRAHWMRGPLSVIVGGAPWRLGDRYHAYRIGEDPGWFDDDDRWVLETELSGGLGKFKFYTTHLSHTDDAANRLRQITQLRESVKATVETGDLPPIVVGDFNFAVKKDGTSDQPQNFQAMSQDFYLATKAGAFCYDGVHGGAPVDQIWIGRHSSFPQTRGVFRAVRLHANGDPWGIFLKEPMVVDGVLVPQVSDHAKAVAMSFVVDTTVCTRAHPRGCVDDIPWGTITAPIITNRLLSDGTVGQQYSQSLTANGGTPRYAWQIDEGIAALPPGITLTATTGVLSGRPTTPGDYRFALRVWDSGAPPLTAVQPLQIVVHPYEIVIASDSLRVDR